MALELSNFGHYSIISIQRQFPTQPLGAPGDWDVRGHNGRYMLTLICVTLALQPTLYLARGHKERVLKKAHFLELPYKHS